MLLPRQPEPAQDESEAKQDSFAWRQRRFAAGNHHREGDRRIEKEQRREFSVERIEPQQVHRVADDDCEQRAVQDRPSRLSAQQRRD